MSRPCPRTSHGFTVNSLYGPVIHFLQSVGLQFSLKFLLYIIQYSLQASMDIPANRAFITGMFMEVEQTFIGLFSTARYTSKT